MTPRRSALLRHLGALAAYAALSVVFTWPIVLRFSTRALGPQVDAPFWRWWLWHFRYAIATRGATPLWSDLIYWPYGANLLLQHGWSYAALGFWLQKWMNVTAAYNLLMLSNFALAGYGVFLAASEWGAGWGAAFTAGAAYAFAPDAVNLAGAGVGFDHLSRQPLPFFVWALTRAARGGRLSDAILTAAILTWLWGCDYYFFLVALLFIPLFFAVLRRPLRVEISEREESPLLRRTKRMLELGLAADVAWLAVSLRHGQVEFHGRGGAAELAGYVAPYLMFWGLLGLRLLARWKPRAAVDREAWRWPSIAPFIAVVCVYAALNLPIVLIVIRMLLSDGAGGTAHAWRGGGNPTDIALWLRPASFHPLWGSLIERAFGASRPPVVGLGYAPMLAALWLWRRGESDGMIRLWFAGLAFSLLLAAGPWLKVLGFQTYLPLPFYFMHLLPLYNNIQTGFVLTVFVALFLSLLLAAAIVRLRAPAWLAFAAVALEFAHTGIPNHGTQISPLYARLGEKPEGAMLPVPMGACFDGTNAAGAFGVAVHQPDFQIQHRHPIVGGLIGRVPRRVFEQMTGDPFLRALVSAEMGGPVAPALTDPRSVRRSLERMRVRYVLIYGDRTPERLRRAIAAWPVALVDQDPVEGLRLYVTTAGPAAESGGKGPVGGRKSHRPG